MLTFFLLAPIVVAIAVLIFDMRHGVNRKALFTSLIITMSITMFAMKLKGTWYAFFFAMTVPMAVLYTAFCLYMSIQESRGKGDGGEDER